MKKVIFAMIFCALPLSAYAVDTLNNISVMALGPLDGRAVVQLPNGSMQILKAGDAIIDTDIKVLQVLSDRLVLQDTVKGKDGDMIKQMVWVYKAIHGESRVQRLQLR